MDISCLFIDKGSDEALLKSLQGNKNIDQEELKKSIDKSKLIPKIVQVNGKNGTYSSVRYVKATEADSQNPVRRNRGVGKPLKTKATAKEEESSLPKINKVSSKTLWNNAHKAYDTLSDSQRWRVGIDDHSIEELDKEAVCFSTEKGSSFAVKNDGDIVCLCKYKGDTVRARELLQTAISNGGKKLDAFGEDLYNLYVKSGFEPVSWCAFEDAYAPDAWKRANGFDVDDTSWYGTPNEKLTVEREEIVFYKYTGEHTEVPYSDFIKSTQKSDSYDSAHDERERSMENGN